MKKAIFGILLSLIFISCSNSDDKIKESISVKIKENLKVPDSFEFVSMKITSKISLDTLKKRVNLKSINEFKELIKDSEDTSNKDFLKTMEKQFEFTENYKGNNSEAAYYVNFIAKGTNSFGAIIQSSYEAFVLNNDDKTTLSVTEIDK